MRLVFTDQTFRPKNAKPLVDLRPQELRLSFFGSEFQTDSASAGALSDWQLFVGGSRWGDIFVEFVLLGLIEQFLEVSNRLGAIGIYDWDTTLYWSIALGIEIIQIRGRKGDG